jgi:hypothetical protein
MPGRSSAPGFAWYHDEFKLLGQVEDKDAYSSLRRLHGSAPFQH